MELFLGAFYRLCWASKRPWHPFGRGSWPTGSHRTFSSWSRSSTRGSSHRCWTTYTPPPCWMISWSRWRPSTTIWRNSRWWSTLQSCCCSFLASPPTLLSCWPDCPPFGGTHGQGKKQQMPLIQGLTALERAVKDTLSILGLITSSSCSEVLSDSACGLSQLSTTRSQRIHGFGPERWIHPRFPTSACLCALRSWSSWRTRHWRGRAWPRSTCWSRSRREPEPGRTRSMQGLTRSERSSMPGALPSWMSPRGPSGGLGSPPRASLTLPFQRPRPPKIFKPSWRMLLSVGRLWSRRQTRRLSPPRHRRMGWRVQIRRAQLSPHLDWAAAAGSSCCCCCSRMVVDHGPSLGGFQLLPHLDLTARPEPPAGNWRRKVTPWEASCRLNSEGGLRWALWSFFFFGFKIFSAPTLWVIIYWLREVDASFDFPAGWLTAVKLNPWWQNWAPIMDFNGPGPTRTRCVPVIGPFGEAHIWYELGLGHTSPGWRHFWRVGPGPGRRIRPRSSWSLKKSLKNGPALNPA